jgi:Zn-dependent protease
MAGAVLFLGSILGHELGHAIVARRRGLEVDGISLWLLGGVARLIGQPRTPSDQIQVSLAGPAVSVALGAGFVAAGFALGGISSLDAVAGLFGWLGWVNVVLGLVNLLPGLPLDGGRVVQGVLWRIQGDRMRATVGAARAGRVVGVAIGAFGIYQLVNGNVGGIWTMFIGLFVGAAAKGEEAAASTQQIAAGARVGDVMTPRPESVPDYLTVADFLDQHVARSRQPAYPVVAFSGHVIGLVTLDALRPIPEARRADIRLRDVAVPAELLTWAAPDEPLGTALQRRHPAGGGFVLVWDGRRLAGIVNPADLQQWEQRRRLLGVRSH